MNPDKDALAVVREYREAGWALHFFDGRHEAFEIGDGPPRLAWKSKDDFFIPEVAGCASRAIAHSDISDVITVQRDGTALGRILRRNVRCMALSPDGKRLAYVQSDDQLRVTDLDANQDIEVPSTALDKSEFPVAWGPDSQRLVCVAADSAIKIVRIGSDEVTTIGTGNLPAWSTEGGHIAYLRRAKKSRTADLCLYTVEDGQTATIGRINYYAGSLALSPDGKYVCYAGDEVSAAEGPGSSSMHPIVLHRLSDGKVMRATGGMLHLNGPCEWSIWWVKRGT